MPALLPFKKDSAPVLTSKTKVSFSRSKFTLTPLSRAANSSLLSMILSPGAKVMLPWPPLVNVIVLSVLYRFFISDRGGSDSTSMPGGTLTPTMQPLPRLDTTGMGCCIESIPGGEKGRFSLTPSIPGGSVLLPGLFTVASIFRPPSTFVITGLASGGTVVLKFLSLSKTPEVIVSCPTGKDGGKPPPGMVKLIVTGCP